MRSHLYAQRNAAGWTAETWFHGLGCRAYFVVERHTVTNEVRPAALLSHDVPAGQSGAPAGVGGTGDSPDGRP